MTSSTYLRLSIILVFLVSLLALYMGVHDDSQRLLTPLASVGFPMIISMALAFGLAYFAVQGLTSRLARRLVILGTMATTLYLSGEDYRGIHAISAFNGSFVTARENWEILGFPKGSTITGMRPGQSKAYPFPANADAIAAVGPASCVVVQVDRTPDGIERISPHMKPLTAADITNC